MCHSDGDVWLRPSDIGAGGPAIPTAPDWRVSRDPGITRWVVTDVGRSDAVSNRAAAVRGEGGGWPQGATLVKEET